MAHTTLTSEPHFWAANPSWLREKNFWFGRPVPDGVTHIELSRNVFMDQMLVRWKTKTGEIHSMPFEHTDESVQAVLTAMKLTC